MRLAARCLDEHLEALVQVLDRLRALMAAVDARTNLTLSQALHWYAMAREFRPDLIVELGRSLGNTTCVFTEFANQASGTRCISICNTNFWADVTVPRLAEVVPETWFAPLDAVVADIVGYDLSSAFADARRILLVWDAHGNAVADQVLARYMPRMAHKPHLVLLHDISDNRYSITPMDYGGRGFWRGMHGGFAGKTARVNLGWVMSYVDQVVPVLDFVQRNGIRLHSADHDVYEDIVGHAERAARILNGPLQGVLRSVNDWAYFTLNEGEGPFTFPEFMGVSHIGAGEA